MIKNNVGFSVGLIEQLYDVRVSPPSIHVSYHVSFTVMLPSLMTAAWLRWFQASHLHTPLSRRREETRFGEVFHKHL